MAQPTFSLAKRSDDDDQCFRQLWQVRRVRERDNVSQVALGVGTARLSMLNL